VRDIVACPNRGACLFASLLLLSCGLPTGDVPMAVHPTYPVLITCVSPGLNCSLTRRCSQQPDCQPLDFSESSPSNLCTYCCIPTALRRLRSDLLECVCDAAYGTIPAVARVPTSSPPPPAMTMAPTAKPTTKPTTKPHTAPHAAPHAKPHAKPHTKPHAKPTTPVSFELKPCVVI